MLGKPTGIKPNSFLASNFYMKNVRKANVVLVNKIIKSDYGIILLQEHYVLENLRFIRVNRCLHHMMRTPNLRRIKSIVSHYQRIHRSLVT